MLEMTENVSSSVQRKVLVGETKLKNKKGGSKSVSRSKRDFLSVPTTPFGCLYHFILKKRLERQVQVCKSESFKFIHMKSQSVHAKTLDKVWDKTKPILNHKKVGINETYSEPADVVTLTGGQELRTGIETHQLLNVSKKLDSEIDRRFDDCPYHEIYSQEIYKAPYYYSDVTQEEEHKIPVCASPEYFHDTDFSVEDHQNQIKAHNHYHEEGGVEKFIDWDWADSTNYWNDYLYNWNNGLGKTKLEVNPLVSFYKRNNDKNLNPPNSIRQRKRRRRRLRKKKQENKIERFICTPTTCNYLTCCRVRVPYSLNNNCGCKSRLCTSDFDGYYYPRYYSMARKRYETAFLPSNSHTNNDQSPDVDSLLLAIESTSLVDQDVEQEKNDNHHHHPIIMRHTNIYNDHHHHQHDCDPSISFRSPNSPITIVRPHLHHHQVDHQVHLGHSESLSGKSHNHHVPSSIPPPHSFHASSSSPIKPKNLNVIKNIIKGDEEIISDSDSSSIRPTLSLSINKIGQRGSRKTESEDKKFDDPGHINFDSLNLCSPRKLNNPNPNLPLSEPLPIKRYTNAHSSSCHSRGGKLSGTCDKRNLTKEYSISSLESLDSTQSEDLQMQLQTQHFSFTKIRGHGGGGCSNNGKSKLLSPISDKSPLESKSIQLHGLVDMTESHGHSHNFVSRSETSPWTSQNLLVNSAELNNVPWECPKLRRKLALLADSGISLDLPPSSGPCARDFDFNFTSSSSSSSRPNFFQSRDGDFSSSSSTRTRLRDLESQGPISHGDSLSSDHHPTSGQQEKRCNLDLKLPLRSESEDDYETQRFNVEERGNYLSSSKPDRGKVWLDFSGRGHSMMPKIEFDPTLELECQDWFHGAVTRSEAEAILRPTKEGSFLVRNCESSNFNQYSLSLKSTRGFIHIRIEPNSLGTFSLGDQEFPSVPYLVQHFMLHRLPIKGAEHVKLIFPIGGEWL